MAVASPGGTYGLKFNLNKPPPRSANRLSRSTAKPGCYDYRCLPSDFASRVAGTFGVRLEQLLLDNRDALRDRPDAFLGGTTLLLCGMKDPPAIIAVQQPPISPQPSAMPVNQPAPQPAPQPAVSRGLPLSVRANAPAAGGQRASPREEGSGPSPWDDMTSSYSTSYTPAAPKPSLARARGASVSAPPELAPKAPAQSLMTILGRWEGVTRCPKDPVDFKVEVNAQVCGSLGRGNSGSWKRRRIWQARLVMLTS